ncbi:MAG TPA: hypothetical protein VEZ16_08675 [Microvirga sp.]|nr:hypothetical protein [Microvirga sp.]
MAIRAPACATAADLDSWCLPLGWEGPFSDYWANRSRPNAIIGASLNRGAGLLAFGIGMVASMRPAFAGSRIEMILQIQALLLLALTLKSLVLNDPS